MLKHIVMWKLKDEAMGNSKCKNAKLMKEKLLSLKVKIHEIKSMEVGIKAEEAGNNGYDIILITEFNNFDDLNTYRIHPEHKKVVGFINEITTERAAIDYII